MFVNPFDSLACIAKNTICKKNPFPPLPGFEQDNACKYGLTDLTVKNAAILRDAIESKATFDTGWCSCQKEIRSFRIISNGSIATVQVFEEIDDICDIISNADECSNLTDQQVKNLIDLWYSDTEMQTEMEVERTIPVDTYENIMKTLSEIEEGINAYLKSCYDTIIEWIKDVSSAI